MWFRVFITKFTPFGPGIWFVVEFETKTIIHRIGNINVFVLLTMDVTGHEEVWHGYIDIILGSHEGITPESSISSTVELVETTEDEDNSDDSQYTTPIKKIKDGRE